MFRLGYMISEGIGCEKNQTRAVDLFRMSATQGVPEAMLKMSDLCYEGVVPGGKGAAFDWCSSAADRGYVPAIYKVATMLYQGDGIGRDLPRALDLYRDLADKGEADAMFMVGRMVYEGLGTEKDEKRGFELLCKASAMGSQLAIQMVSDMRRRQNAQLITIDDS